MKRTVIFITVCLFGLFVDKTKADIIFDPIVGTGTYTLLNNGGFELGIAGWADNLGQSQGRGTFETGGAVNIVGAESAFSHPNFSFNGPGFTTNQIVTVVPNESYVVSGYVYTGDLSNPNDAPRLDVIDIANTTQFTNVSSIGSEGRTQFLFATFTVPSTENQVLVRLLRDGAVTAGERAYYDDIALTLASEFVAPTTVPEPSSFAVVAMSMVAIYGIRQGRTNHAVDGVQKTRIRTIK
ncbi:MAG: hypothetical protein R3C03_11520 [Pirellulaceae bacterium]